MGCLTRVFGDLEKSRTRQRPCRPQPSVYAGEKCLAPYVPYKPRLTQHGSPSTFFSDMPLFCVLSPSDAF